MITNLFKFFFQKTIQIWHQIKGISIKNNVSIDFSANLSGGFLNGKKGKIYIEKNCELSQGVVIKAYGGNVVIGENTFLGEYVTIYGHGGVEIGANCLIAMHTCILSSNHTVPTKDVLIRSQGDILLPVKIGNDVWIGAGVKILGGVTIGNGCVVGAGAVVSKSLPPYSIAVGVPATIIKYRNG